MIALAAAALAAAAADLAGLSITTPRGDPAPVDARAWVVSDAGQPLTVRAYARRIDDVPVVRAIRQGDVGIAVLTAALVGAGLAPGLNAFAHREPLKGERATAPIGLVVAAIGLVPPMVWCGIVRSPRSIDRFYTRTAVERRLAARDP